LRRHFFCLCALEADELIDTWLTMLAGVPSDERVLGLDTVLASLCGILSNERVLRVVDSVSAVLSGILPDELTIGVEHPLHFLVFTPFLSVSILQVSNTPVSPLTSEATDDSELS
jgi:hypothetical protein